MDWSPMLKMIFGTDFTTLNPPYPEGALVNAGLWRSKMDKLMTWEQFSETQPFKTQFGEWVRIAGSPDPQVVGPIILEKLAFAVAKGIWRHGYKPSGTFQIAFSGEREDPLNADAVIGVKLFAEFEATPLKYVAYCENYVSLYQTVVEQQKAVIRQTRTWRGFLSYKFNKFKRWFVNEEEE